MGKGGEKKKKGKFGAPSPNRQSSLERKFERKKGGRRGPAPSASTLFSTTCSERKGGFQIRRGRPPNYLPLLPYTRLKVKGEGGLKKEKKKKKKRPPPYLTCGGGGKSKKKKGERGAALVPFNFPTQLKLRTPRARERGGGVSPIPIRPLKAPKRRERERTHPRLSPTTAARPKTEKKGRGEAPHAGACPLIPLRKKKYRKEKKGGEKGIRDFMRHFSRRKRGKGWGGRGGEREPQDAAFPFIT